MSALAALAALTLVFTLLAASCAKPAPQPEEKEDTHETLFNILYSDNNHKSNLSLNRLRGFYAGGAPSELPKLFASSHTSLELRLEAAVGDSVFDEDTEFIEFINKLLTDASIIVNSRRDPVEKNSVTNIDIMLSGQRLAGADVIIEDGERIGINLRELYPKYIALEFPDLMNIISDVTGISALGQISYDNYFPLGGRIIDLLNLTDVDRERSKSIFKPFIDRLKNIITSENIVVEHGENEYKKVSVNLVSEDLKRVLTALVQAAKDNPELSALIKDKYAIIYDCFVGLNEYGIKLDPGIGGLPSVDSIDGLLNSLLSALESMLGSAAELPVQALAADFHLDGVTLVSVDFKAWIELPPIEDNRDTDENSENNGDSTSSPVYIINNAGAPDIKINISSIDYADGWRTDSFTAEFSDGDGVLNAVEMTSRLSGGNTGGINHIEAIFTGPAFDGSVPCVNISYEWEGDKKSASLYSFVYGPSGAAIPLLHITGGLSGNEGAGGYLFNAELKLNDPNALYAPASNPTGGAPAAQGAEGGSGYAINLNADGMLTFGQTPIPSLRGEDVYMLVQDSFYDGTFEAIYNEFYLNLIRFASANRQILSLYGFPGF